MLIFALAIILFASTTIFRKSTFHDRKNEPANGLRALGPADKLAASKIFALATNKVYGTAYPQKATG